MRPNVLLITLDQFRADCLSAAEHAVVRTPHLDALARDGVRFARHYSQAAPCGPGRASLYTGMYAMNHRVVGNGSPLDRRFDNIAMLARRAGYEPALFGYTDQAIDPRDATGSDDPRLFTYNGILSGFDPILHVPDDQGPWVEWLDSLGYDVSVGSHELLASEHARPVEHSVGAFVTDTFLDWHASQHDGWCAHISHLRPHPPYSAAGEWSNAYDPNTIDAPIGAEPQHWFHRGVLERTQAAAPTDPHDLAVLRAQYFGMVSHIDEQVGRVFTALKERGDWDNTVIIVTADHGEMLGDHGLIEKLGYWEQSYAIPCIIRDPSRMSGHGTAPEFFTENVDIMPTVAELISVDIPAQCDGRSLVAFLNGDSPNEWRAAAHWEYDWRTTLIGSVPHEWPNDRMLERQHLAVTRTDTHAYVQFGNGDALCFDLVADPTWRTITTDPAVILPLAQEMLTWRSRHTDRLLADLVIRDGGVGRWPPVDWQR